MSLWDTKQDIDVEGSFSSNSANLNVTCVGYQAGYGFTTGYQNVLIEFRMQVTR